ncbi:MAG TPA: BTAD domain-containing putative transcriptional regulator [Nocardioidaceae bacterium]|nr:BTAD domain-containing putative transcriptional regulator [Nocardioidaceae bacterium]
MPEPRVHIRLLGGFEVTVDDRPVPARSWRRRSAANLVKLLALQPGRRMLREQVVDALWPDMLVDEAAPRLHVAAHFARAATESQDAVVLAGGAVSLFPTAAVTLDVDQFDRAADAARDTEGQEKAARAASLYAGTLLPEDLYEPWTEEPRDRLRLRHLELLRAAGRYEELVAAEPLDEEAHLLLVRERVARGQRQTALRALDRMTDLFRRELGVDPGPAALTLRKAAESLPVEAAVPVQRSAPRSSPAASRGSPLPAPRSRLIGRDADLTTVDALLRTHRIVTITGPGGAGKSTLALALARRFRDDPGPDGETDVVLAELAPVRDDAEVTRAVAEAAGVQGEGAVQTGALAATLGPRAVLLVLDNCEHLLDASAALVDAVLDAGPQARILVTSREPLRVDGEGVHRIGSLGSESSELFVERAVAAAGAGVAAADDPRVVELCERLDGLPLAIELAAAQLRHLSLEELIERLDDRLTLLVGGRPKAGPRHSALTATIEWSYRLLSEDARRLFDRLGVFPAAFDLDAVRAVAGESARADVTNLLGDLVAKSLVVHEPADRQYRLLETLRLFAARRLDDSGLRAEVTELLRRHVVARSAAVPRVRAWLSASMAARSRDDLENVRLAFESSLEVDDLPAAVDVALGISTLWRNAVSYSEGRRWVAELSARDLSPPDRLWTLILTADVGLGSGDPRMMRDAAERATALGAQLDDPGATVVATIYDAMANLITPQRAAARLDDAAALAREAGEPSLERLARAFRVVAHRLLGLTEGLDEEVRALVDADSGGGYDRYICIWAASLVALVDRDGPRLRRLMDAQLADLMDSGLQENWLTMYWGALLRIVAGEDYLPQLRRSRRRAEAEGRRADADCVLALGYAAACHDQWEAAAELVGAAAGALQRDTAGFIHHVLVREQLVRPRLEPEVFTAAVARGAGLDLGVLMEKHCL